MKICIATLDDVKQIAKTHRESFIEAHKKLVPHLESLPLSEQDFISRWTKRLALKDSITLIMQDNELVKGLINFYQIDKNVEIHLLYIHPNFQHQGLGKQLIKAAMEVISVFNVESVYVSTLKSNRNSRAFYEALGWKTDGTECFNQTLQTTDIVYQKKLSLK